MTTYSEVVPITFGDLPKSQIPTRKDTATHIVPTRTALSLEVVKGIWRTYPKVPTPLRSEEAGALAVVQPTTQGANALELNLGAEERNNAPSRSPSTPTSHDKADGVTTGIVDAESVTLATASGLTGSPEFEHASDSMEISPAVSNHDLLQSNGPSQHSLQQGKPPGDRSHPSTSPTSANPQLSPSAHSMQDVRSLLLGLMWKTVQRRYPNKAITHEQFSERFAQKMSDADVREFMETGKDVIEGLRHSGLLEEAKRKYVSEDGEGEQRRTRRRLNNSSPQPVEGLENDQQGQGSVSGSRGSSPSTSAKLNIAPPSGPSAMLSSRSKAVAPPRAPRAMLSKNWRDSPHVTQPTEPSAASRRETTPQPEDKLSTRLSPGEIPEDDHLSTPEAPRPVPLLSRAALTSSDPPPTAGDAGGDTVAGVSFRGHESSSHLNQVNRQAGSASHPENKSLPESHAASILLAKVGLSSMGLLNASFDLDEQLFAATRRWAERAKRFDPANLGMKLHLIGIPTIAAEQAHQDRPQDAPPSFLAEKVSQISVAWPPPGTLYVTLNGDRPDSMSWSDMFFGPSTPALDLSGVVVEGTNTIEFVQLEDHSQTIFIVLAIPPNETEQQDALASHSRRQAWVQLSQNHHSKTHVKLQFDASSEERNV